MTERIYYHDSYCREFTARVVETCEGGRRIYLDRTCFYPTSGGQPNDTGIIAGIPVEEVIDEEKRIAHLLARPLTAAGDLVQGRIDWTRRFDHMQQHSGQHLLSAVFARLFGFATVGFHLGSETSTIDLDTPELPPDQLEIAEREANRLVFENRPIGVFFCSPQEAGELRKPSARTGELRVVAIEGLDRSACGGTHVRRTGEIGPILLRKTEKIRGSVRVEFVCGCRAVRRARTEYNALAHIARQCSCAPEDAPTVVEQQQARLAEAVKSQRRLEAELAVREGAELYRSIEPAQDGIRRLVRRLGTEPIGDAVRALAQAFTAGSKAVFAAVCDDPPSLLLAVSPDSGLHAGNLLKAAVAACGGRGGGSATLAQGSVPAQSDLNRVLAAAGFPLDT